MIGNTRLSRGFALPTIVVSSVLLFTVLVTAASVASSARTALNTQYQQALARDAAESGTTYAAYCYGVAVATASSSQWPNSGTLDSGDNCYGEPSDNCGSASPGDSCYVVNTGTTRTRFSVSTATVSGIGYQFTAQGVTDLVRSTSGAVAQSWGSSISYKGAVSVSGIASGNDTVCAIQLGKLYCWGKNNYGQVGNGLTSTVKTPTVVQGTFENKYVYGVGTGVSHTCAIAGPTPSITTSAQLFCWGDNSQYQYGIGNNTTSSLTPMLAANTSSRYPVAVSSRDHTCTIQVSKSDSTDRVEACWGNNQYGQAGESGGATATPTLLDPKPSMGYGFRLRTSPYAQLSNVQKINNVSGNTSCGIDGTNAYCIGRNNAGQLGDGTTSGTNPRVQYATTNAKTIVTNAGKVCVIRTEGGYNRTWCWGGNGPVSSEPPDFRLDSGPNFNSGSEFGTPQRLVTTGPLLSKNVTDIAMTDWNICQVISGVVYCSGYNDVGQLGQGYVSGPARGDATSASQVRSANSAVAVQGALKNKYVVRIEGGNDFFCAITRENGVFCWGYNNYGQLGDGSTTTRTSPVPVKLPAPVIF